MSSHSRQARSEGGLGRDDGASQRPSRWQGILWALAVFWLFLTFATFQTCYSGETSDICEADPSFGFILSHAYHHNLQFGEQLAYTYGPLGFLSFLHYPPGTAALQVLVNSMLGIAVAAGLCLVARHLGWRRGALLLVSFGWIASSLEVRNELVINAGLLSWGLLCFLENGLRLRLSIGVFIVLAAFSALAKNSFLVISSGSALLIAASMFLRKQYRCGIGMIAGFAFVLLLGWSIAGQSLHGIVGHFQNVSAIIQGYSGALGWEGNTPGAWAGVALVCACGILLVAQCLIFRRNPAGNFVLDWFLPLWLGGMLFAAWKHGFVRAHPMNLEMFLAFSSVLAIALGVLENRDHALQKWVSRAGIGTWCAAVFFLQWFFLPPPGDSILAMFRSAGTHLTYLLSPSQYERDMERLLEANRSRAQLPRIRSIAGDRSVDVFGRKQAYAFYNKLNYQPRPVPQSYAVCNRHLMRLNEQFFARPDAPDFVLFELESLDRKLPALEDAWSLRHLLINYEPVAAEPPFLVLRKRREEPARLELIRQGSVQPGELIDLRGVGTNMMWIEVDVKPTWTGRLREILLRPPIARIAIWDEQGSRVVMRRRAPSNMLSAGFIGRPLLLRTEDVVPLYGGVSRPGTAGYSIEFDPGDARYWQPDIAFRVYRIENSTGGSLSDEARSFVRVFQEQAQSGNPWSRLQERPSTEADGKPFVLFRNSRWRATQPLPGNPEENLTFLLILALPFFLGWRLVVFAKKRSNAVAKAGRLALLWGNLLVLGFLSGSVVLVGEIYYRFFYDTTDSLGYTLVCERWVQRHWQVNGAGCRDDIEYNPEITIDRRRMTFLGDSFAAGHGIKDVKERFPNRLRGMKPGWEVHVLASVGLDTSGERILLTRALNKGYQVDEVFLVYCLNDIASEGAPENSNVEGQGLALENRSWLLRNSYFINFAYHRFQSALDPRLKDYFPGLIESYQGAAWERQASEFRQLRDLVEEHGGRLSVVIFPFLHALGENYEYQVAHDKVAGLCQELNIACLDLLPIYRDMPARSLTVNPFDAHPNELANQLAADAIADFMSGLPPR